MSTRFQTRPYQRPLWDFLTSGGRRAVAVWHRRSGKDTVGLNHTLSEMLEHPGTYWHMLPTLKQAKKVVWNRVDRETGRKYVDLVFDGFMAKKNSTDMTVEIVNGAMWQLLGSDNPDSWVGGDPRGVVFSEWSLTNPAAWDFCRPILAENGGWALFIYTPRGRNHGFDLFKMAESNPNWFCQRLTIDETEAISMDAVQEDRDSGMAEELIEQEYWCSFDAPLVGAYYGKQLKDARDQGRITAVPHDEGRLVYTAWDIGKRDSTAIWFFQKIGPRVHVIDFYQSHGYAFSHYVKVLRERPYEYGTHYVPHDFAKGDFAAERTPLEQANELRMDVDVVPRTTIQLGIEAARLLLGKCWFDEVKCKEGVNALSLYHKEWDEEKKIYKDNPVHDWTSHPADAFRYLALGMEENYRDAIADLDPLNPQNFEPSVDEMLAEHFRKARDGQEDGRI